MIVQQLNLSGRRPHQTLGLLDCFESLIVISGQITGFDLENPIPTNHRGHSIWRQICLEGRLVELRIAECRKTRGLSPHGGNEPLLSLNQGSAISETEFIGELHKLLGLMPYCVERSAREQKPNDDLTGARSGEKEIACLNPRTERCLEVIDRCCERPHPRDNYSHCIVHLRGVDNESPLLHKIESELAEPKPFVVALERIA